MKKILFLVLISVSIANATLGVLMGDTKETKKEVVAEKVKEKVSLDSLESKILDFTKDQEGSANINLEELSSIEQYIPIIKENTFKEINYKENNYKIDTLKFKVTINKKKGFTTAANRDLVKITYLQNELKLLSLFRELNAYHDNFIPEETFKTSISNFKKNVKTSDLAFIMNVSEKDTVSFEFNNSLKKLHNQYNLYLYLSDYLLGNSYKLVKHSLIISVFDIQYLSDKINDIPGFESANQYSTLLLKTEFGRIVIALMSVCLMLLLNFVLIPLVIKLVNPYIQKYKESRNNQVEDYGEFIKDSILRPFRLFIGVLALQVFTEIIYTEQFNIERFNLIESILYWVAFIWLLRNLISNGISTFSDEILKKYKDARKEILLFLNQIVNFILVLFLIGIILSKNGVDLTLVVGGLGFVGLGASLAFKDTFSNLLGSINVIFNKSISVGDWIAFEKIEGTVIEIGMRNTRLRSFANGEYSVPNSILANTIILNWNRRQIGRRIRMDIKLDLTTDRDSIDKIVEDLRTLLRNNPAISNEKSTFKGRMKKRHKHLIKADDDIGVKKTLLVYFDKISDQSFDIMVYAFSETVSWEEWLEVKQDVLFGILKVVEDNNSMLAFPTQVNILKNTDSILAKEES